VRDPEILTELLNQLAAELHRHADELDLLATDLETHPAPRFLDHADEILMRVSRFELARSLRREGPILRASEDLVLDLLEQRLAPIVRELVAAMVRFEWYFHPLKVPRAGRQVVFGGLSTPDEQLDARLVLNAGERSLVGLGWFLSLHLLQPEDRRQVLVLDDPTATLDPFNQAGVVSTLRAFLRLARPEQVVVASQDEGVAGLLSEELAPVDGWPSSITKVRCSRDAHGFSVAEPAWSESTTRVVAEEVERLGLSGTPPLIA
jgi:hypothetical protein